MQDLQPQVKLKLLLAFFHISRRNLETWRPQLDQILDVRDLSCLSCGSKLISFRAGRDMFC